MSDDQLRVLVEETFGDIIRTFSFRLVIIDSHRALLVKDEFAIGIFAGRDGVELEYFLWDKKGTITRYDIFDFIVDVRGFEPAPGLNEVDHHRISRGELTRCELVSCAYTLTEKGNDILIGSQEWIASYRKRPWILTDVMSGPIRSALGNAKPRRR